jgi:hypothetical protein
MKEEFIIFQNKKEIAQNESNFENGQRSLQAVVEAFHTLGVGDITTIEELGKLMQINMYGQRAVDQIGAFVEQKIESQITDDQVPRFGMFKMKKRDVVKSLEQPDLTPFIEIFKENWHLANAALSLAQLSKGKISLDKAKHTAMIKAHTTAAETPQEREVLSRLHQIINILNELHQSGVIVDSDLQRFKQIRLLANSSDLQVDPAFFKQIQNRISNNQN